MPNAPYFTSKVRKGLALIRRDAATLYIEKEGRIEGERTAKERAAMRAALRWIDAKCGKAGGDP